jgi:hypothetical protein
MEHKNAAKILAQYTSGSPYLAEACPSPAIFDIVDPEHATTVFAKKAAAREAFIAAYTKENHCERFVGAITYDSQMAPMTTNATQLKELGITVPTVKAITTKERGGTYRMTEEVVHTRLWNIVYGLARLGVYLVGTDTFTNRELLLRLCSRVLKDVIRDFPPNPDMNEFIDLSQEEEPITVRALPTPDRTKVFGDGESSLKIDTSNVDAFVANLTAMITPPDQN